VVPGKHTVDREVLVKEGHDLLGTRSSTPITHKIADNREERDELDTCLLHAGVGRVADEFRVGSRGFDVGKDRVAFGAEGKSEEGSADIGGDTCDDDLLLAGGFDGGLKFRVVPGTVIMLDDCLVFVLLSGFWLAYLTSPWRRISGALGYISSISLGRGPLGPVSAEVLMMTGRLKSLPTSAWAKMFCLYRVGSQSRATP
jgi:hypothetical protein